jgi:oxygen-independent coproporphyrinogen-3 oxidase
MAIQKLEGLGLKRYEISAFAKPGFESRHNLGYWTGRPFLGLGPSAFSHFDGARYRNIANLHRYTKALKENRSPVDFEETLPYPANVNELLAVALRLKEGVDLSSLKVPEETLQNIEKLKEMSLLKQEAQRLIITEKGMLFYDTLAAEII